MHTVTIEKRGQLLATAKTCEVLDIPGEDAWEGICLIKCCFFGTVSLAPPVLFEHLAGTGLGKFFDGSEVLFDNEPLATYLRYVHGRSEVMHGKPIISSVLLARPEPEGGVTDTAWLTYLPEIYRKFLATHNLPSKSA